MDCGITFTYVVLLSVKFSSTIDSDLSFKKQSQRFGEKFCVSGDYVCFNDNLAYQVFSELHSEIDDDKDGDVEPEEAHDFAREQLKYSDVPSRAKRFSKYDNHISKDELWLRWKNSEIYRWTEKDVQNWLLYEIELPEYSENFVRHKIDGSSIPKLAMKNFYYLTYILKISSAIHRQKLRIKTIDLILFGPPKNEGIQIKDVIFFITFVITLSLSCVAFQKYKENQNCLLQLATQLESLAESENSLIELSKKLKTIEQNVKTSQLEKEKLRRQYENEIYFAKLKVQNLSRERLQTEEKIEQMKLAKEELLHLKNMLEKAENLQKKDFSTDYIVLLLQFSYEIELQGINSLRNLRDNFLLNCDNGIQVQNDIIKPEDLLLKWKWIERLIRLKLFPSPGYAKIRNMLEMRMKPDYQRFYGKPKVFKAQFKEPLPTVDEFDDYDCDNYYDEYCQTVPFNFRNCAEGKMRKSPTVHNVISSEIGNLNYDQLCRRGPHCLITSSSCSAISNLQTDDSSDMSETAASISAELTSNNSVQASKLYVENGKVLKKKEPKYKTVLRKRFSRNNK